MVRSLTNITHGRILNRGLSSSYPRTEGNSQIGETSLFSTADRAKSTDYSSKDNPRILPADFGGISQPSTSREITDVSRALAELRPQYIYLPQTEEEVSAAHARARNVVERQYGVWKKRFSCNDTPFRCSLETAQTVIVATALLHYFALSLGDYEDEYSLPLQQDDTMVNHSQEHGGIAKRNAIVANFFN
ncbi:nuclease HARBI1 [Trichonephila clavipes]|nr:nuclease HARBI1 [Trichonephila clavipes]